MSAVGPANDAALVKQVCQKMGKSKRGAIVVEFDQICVKIEVPEDMDGDSTAAHVNLVCLIADDLEKEIFGVDER